MAKHLYGDKRYYSLNYYFKETFGEKIFKIPLDGGFDCPNRDGKVAFGGCTFCSNVAQVILLETEPITS